MNATLAGHEPRSTPQLPELKPMLNSKSIELEDPGNGNRLIHIAAQNGHQEILELLIKSTCVHLKCMTACL